MSLLEIFCLYQFVPQLGGQTDWLPFPKIIMRCGFYIVTQNLCVCFFIGMINRFHPIIDYFLPVFSKGRIVRGQTIRIHQFHRIPHAISIRTHPRVLIRHRVNTQPTGHQFVVHVPCPEVSIPCFLVAFFPGESIPFVVARCTLVDVGFAEGQVLQVLDGLARCVGDPAGAAEVAAIMNVVDQPCTCPPGAYMVEVVMAALGDILAQQRIICDVIHLRFQNLRLCVPFKPGTWRIPLYARSRNMCGLFHWYF